MNTLSLSQSLSRLRMLVTGAAENSTILLHIDQMLQLLKTSEKHNVSINTTLQQELSKVKKEVKTLRKENLSLKATISNQRSDLDMMDLKNNQLHEKLTKLQLKQHT